jgi:serine palmitoyltransferase
MALSQSLSSRSSFSKRSVSGSPGKRDAATLLAAVRQADARARERSSSPTVHSVPTATPALSLSSSFTGDSEDSVLREDASGLRYGHSGVMDPYVVDDNDDGLGVPKVPPTSEQTADTRHTEFGHCWNEGYRHTSAHPVGEPVVKHVEVDPPYYILLSTYLSYILLIMVGHIRDFFGKRAKSPEYRHLMPHNVSCPPCVHGRVRLG